VRGRGEEFAGNKGSGNSCLKSHVGKEELPLTNAGRRWTGEKKLEERGEGGKREETGPTHGRGQRGERIKRPDSRRREGK